MIYCTYQQFRRQNLLIKAISNPILLIILINKQKRNQMSNHFNQLNGYRMLKKLGSGATGDVYMTTKDNKNYALKVYKQMDENMMKCL